ncbi:MAG: multicopper oxidase domain-containing protein [Acidimicrobiales bacterium]
MGERHLLQRGSADSPDAPPPVPAAGVRKNSIPLEQPYWTDTLNIAPGERYTVMFRADDAGVWVWHCHILTHVERSTGMFGMVTAIIVNETPGSTPTTSRFAPATGG